MTFSKDLIQEFQERYFIAFGKNISSELAEKDLQNLAELISITHPLSNSGTKE